MTSTHTCDGPGCPLCDPLLAKPTPAPTRAAAKRRLQRMRDIADQFLTAGRWYTHRAGRMTGDK
jgi:hypothetical protein